MKGIRKKAAKGWFVWYEDESTKRYESLPLFIDELTVFPEDDSIWKDKEIDFEIVKYCPYHQSNPSKCTRDCMHSEVKYAKVVYDVPHEEGESGDSWDGCDGCTEQDKAMYKNGYTRGYNAAVAEFSNRSRKREHKN